LSIRSLSLRGKILEVNELEYHKIAPRWAKELQLGGQDYRCIVIRKSNRISRHTSNLFTTTMLHELIKQMFVSPRNSFLINVAEASIHFWLLIRLRNIPCMTFPEKCGGLKKEQAILKSHSKRLAVNSRSAGSMLFLSSLTFLS
jgi:hypothetical protein